MREDWIEIELEKISKKITDGTHHTPTYISNGTHFISVKDIYNGKVNFEDAKYISEADHKELIKRCFPECGDLLITKSGTIGRMAIVPKSPEFSLFVSVALIKNIKEIVLSKYLMYTLEDYLKSISISQVIKGGLLKNFHLEDIRKTIVKLPPLPIQRAIVRKIETLSASLDKGIADLKTAQEQLKVYRQAVLKKAFEGRFTNNNVKEGDLPEVWKWVKLGELINKITAGKSFRCDERTPRENEVGVLKVSALTWGEFLQDESKTVTDISKINKNFFVNRGDFLLSRANTIELVGNSVIVKNISKTLMLSDKTLKINFLATLNNWYVLYYLRTRKGRVQIENLSTGNQESMRNIGQDRIKQILIPLPPTLSEQHAIVREIESRLSVCDKVEQSIAEALEKAEALRQSILKKAFEGKLLSAAEIAGCKQEADYEPASTLLARIERSRNERIRKEKKNGK